MIPGNYAFISKISNIPEAFIRSVDYNPLKGQQTEMTNAYYRPMLTVSLILNAQIAGQSPFFYHIINILLHILGCWLVYKLFITLNYSRESAIIASLIYAVHPALVQAVAWIPGRNDSLLAVFAFASLIYLIRFQQHPDIQNLWKHLLFVFLTVFTKENAVVLPFLCLFYAFLFDRISVREILKKYGILFLAYFLILLAFYFMRKYALSGIHTDNSFSSLLHSLRENFPIYLQGIQKTFLPYNPSVMTTPADTRYVAVGIVILFLTLVLIFSKEIRWKYVIFGLTWFSLFLLPSLAAKKVTGMEHRIYLPMAGLLMILWETDLIKKTDLKKYSGFFWAVIVLFFIRSYVHVGVFRSWDALWESAIDDNPRSAVVYNNYGFALYNQGLHDKALKMYFRALEIDSNEILIHNNIGAVYYKQKKLQSALEFFKKEIQLNPTYADAYFNLGATYADLGMKKEATEMWKKALEINPQHENAKKALNKELK
jgi:hypothetical protein